MGARHIAIVVDDRSGARRIVGAGENPRAARQDAARRGVSPATVETDTAAALRWAHGAAFDAALDDFLRLRAFGAGAAATFR